MFPASQIQLWAFRLPCRTACRDFSLPPAHSVCSCPSPTSSTSTHLPVPFYVSPSLDWKDLYSTNSLYFISVLFLTSALSTSHPYLWHDLILFNRNVYSLCKDTGTSGETRTSRNPHRKLPNMFDPRTFLLLIEPSKTINNTNINSNIKIQTVPEKHVYCVKIFFLMCNDLQIAYTQTQNIESISND